MPLDPNYALKILPFVPYSWFFFYALLYDYYHKQNINKDILGLINFKIIH